MVPRPLARQGSGLRRAALSAVLFARCSRYNSPIGLPHRVVRPAPKEASRPAQPRRPPAEGSLRPRRPVAFVSSGPTPRRLQMRFPCAWAQTARRGGASVSAEGAPVSPHERTKTWPARQLTGPFLLLDVFNGGTPVTSPAPPTSFQEPPSTLICGVLGVGGPGRTRTCNLPLRRGLLYPIEPRGRRRICRGSTAQRNPGVSQASTGGPRTVLTACPGG